MSQTEERERSVADITEAEKVEFLHSIRQGLDRSEAARVLGYYGKHFRALCSPQSPFYDEDFARTYGEAIGSLEHEQFRLERLRAEGFRRAMTDSDRLLEKFLMVHDPDWQKLRERDVNVNVHAVIENYFRSLPADRLDQIIAWLDEQQGEVVEGEIAELAAVEDAA